MITRYRLESTRDQMNAAVQGMGLALNHVAGARWNGSAPCVIRVGDPAPIIRIAADGDALEFDVRDWGISNRRRLHSVLTSCLP